MKSRRKLHGENKKNERWKKEEREENKINYFHEAKSSLTN
jgi:hypothetical protein